MKQIAELQNFRIAELHSWSISLSVYRSLRWQTPIDRKTDRPIDRFRNSAMDP